MNSVKREKQAIEIEIIPIHRKCLTFLLGI